MIKNPNEISNSKSTEFIEVTYSLPIENPSYKVCLHFDSETGEEVSRVYSWIEDGSIIETSHSHPKITIDIQAFKDTGRLKIMHSSIGSSKWEDNLPYWRLGSNN